jgi:hypothetical protein
MQEHIAAADPCRQQRPIAAAFAATEGFARVGRLAMAHRTAAKMKSLPCLAPDDGGVPFALKFLFDKKFYHAQIVFMHPSIVFET